MDSPKMDTGGGSPCDELYVSPTCFVQTPESRFGAGVLDDLKTFIAHGPYELEVALTDAGSDEEGDGADVEITEENELAYSWQVAFDGSLETDPNHAQHGFPRIATTRNNLTALSQRYNLYFAAYQDRIYVYQPRRTGSQILQSPSVILHPRQSKLGEQVGGTLDSHFPHQVNNIVVGNLGDFEIVLLAYDDGDVIAYYTHTIVRCIRASNNQARGTRSSPGRQTTHPRPFFHENVGRSAWGLAIHEQSRLVAASSNSHDVTVFAFALRSQGRNVAEKSSGRDNSPLLANGQTANQLQKHFESRTRTWRIVLPLGKNGNNVPNISFVDDESGNADKVAAIDIAGSVWLLDIWKIGTHPIRWPDPFFPRESQLVHGARGWGILVLPYSCFRPAKTIREALGVPGGEVIAVARPDAPNRVWLDTTCSLYYIKDLSTNLDILLRQRHARLDYARTHSSKLEWQEDDLSNSGDSESDSGTDESVHAPDTLGTESEILMYPGAACPVSQEWPNITPFSGTAASGSHDTGSEIQLSQCIIPTFGETPYLRDNLIDYTSFNRLFADRQRRTRHVEASNALLPDYLVKDYCILRTNSTDIELQPFDAEAPCIECKMLLTHRGQGDLNSPWDLHPAYSERLSMLIPVPELNLVVVGSPTGSVALITLTKASKRLHLTKVRYGFRVECVLPRKQDEEKNMRPECTLIGVAVSPVPHRPGRGLVLRPRHKMGSDGVVIYRLMMHYKDHTILMYDIARGKEEEGALMIF